MGGSKVFQIVGYKNSGKTTLMEKLIESGNERGLRVGSIKHHGHGGPLDSSYVNNDSRRHNLAGSIVSSVAGDGTLLIEAAKNNWKLDEIIHVYHHFDLDLILVEGYKQSPYPKAVLIRNEKDLALLDHLTNIKVVISLIPIESNHRVFFQEQVDEFIDFFYSWIFLELTSSK
ncbi:molybdopterin-guanine dinucleotide biosynthesis protein B [Bacillus sp. IITD106]|nr:molybdopterin-guanine dinucleotide biosynthesis protein B [Bacillus sp. IITD106]